MVKARYLLAALLGVPLLDATLLVFVAGAIGGVTTVLLVVLTGLVGTLLVRAEGRNTLRRLQGSLAAGEPPTDELLDGAFLIAAGAFLLTPGLVTDVLGFLFVLPPTRYPLRELLSRYVVTPYLDEKTDGFVTGNVYVGGFPGRDGTGGATVDGFGDDDGDDGRTRRSGGDTVDVGDDEYTVE